MPTTRTKHRNRRLAPLSEAAAYAHVHPKTIRRRIADGTLTGYRLGPRVIRVDLDELEQLLRPIPTTGAPPGRSPALASGGTTSAETGTQARPGDAA